MAVVPARAFAAALDELDRAAFGEFVCDLLEARGREVEFLDERTLRVAEESRERLLCLYRPGRLSFGSPTPPDQEIDVLLTNRAESDRAHAFAADLEADLLDGTDLYDRLAYGLDLETADEIAQRHFDRPLSAPKEWAAVERSKRPAIDAVGRLGRVGSPRGALVGAAALAIVLAAAIVGAPLLDSSSGGAFSEGAAGGAVGGTASAGERAGSEVSVTPAPAASAGPELDATNESVGTLPPGLGESGIADAEALADAHEAAVTNRSYRWVVTYEERVDGQGVSTVREVVTAEAPDVYTIALEREGDQTYAATLFSETEAYADGEHRYEPVRVAGSRDDVRETTLGIEDGTFPDRAETYVEWYLSATRSAITDVHEHDNRTIYRVETIGDPYPGAENARASAIVGSEGMVYRLRSEREIPDSDRKVVLTFRYTDIGNATVSPPTWYRTNASNSRRTTTATATGSANAVDTAEDDESD
ncbi:hypothetical protein BRC86_05935 [Halobacteriales archaeon QS_3_64_16]|nr:MAG: hypothetical protein BRC86_05935 [Halobacteriales archaeon QS_3_64_16]